MSDKVSFYDFMLAARENLDRFEFDYIEHHNENPIQYPLEIESSNEGVWWEMLQDFDG